MRPSWAAGYDGIKNLENALRLAASVSAEYGTLVTMNDEIFAAWSVYKTDTGALDAFAARRGAPYGRIFSNQIELAWRPVVRQRPGKIPPFLPRAVSPFRLLSRAVPLTFMEHAGGISWRISIHVLRNCSRVWCFIIS